jgi:hypothetical protein
LSEEEWRWLKLILLMVYCCGFLGLRKMRRDLAVCQASGSHVEVTSCWVVS